MKVIIFGILLYSFIDEGKAIVESGFQFAKSQIIDPSLITRIIFFIISGSACVYIGYAISKNRKLPSETGDEDEKNKSQRTISFFEILGLLGSIAVVIIFGALALNTGTTSDVDQSKNIGIVYNNEITDISNYSLEIDDFCKDNKVKFDHEIDCKFLDIRGKNNPILSIVEFINTENIRYLVFGTSLGNLNIDAIIDHSFKNKFLTLKNYPIKINEKFTSDIVSYFLGPDQEASSIIRSAVGMDIKRLFVIEPGLGSLTPYELSLYQSLEEQTRPQDIILESLKINDLETLKSNQFQNQLNIQSVAVVALGSTIYNVNLQNIFKQSGYDVYLSSKNLDVSRINNISEMNIMIPLPWPIELNENYQLRSKLTKSSIEALMQLDKSITNEDGSKYDIYLTKATLLTDYSYWELNKTQEFFGKTFLSESSFPNLQFNNIEIKSFKQ